MKDNKSLEQILQAKPFDEKVSYFESLKDIDEIDSYELIGENFLCYCIAYHKKIGKYTSIENTIKVQIAHLNQLKIKYNNNQQSKGFDAFSLINCEENLKFLENYLVVNIPFSEHEKQLPPLMGNNIDTIKSKIDSFSTKQEKIIYLERIIKQTGIQKAINLWDEDCSNVVNQLKVKEGWRGVFDAIHGEYHTTNIKNKVVYDFGHKFYKEYLELCNILEGLKKGENKTQINDTSKNYLETDWFKIGLKFATGDAQKCYKKHKDKKGHFRLITQELGFKDTLRPYISETINNNAKNTSGKNIYANQKKLKQIKKHCEDNSIDICEEFLSQIKSD